jgi:hypothetical protein
MFFEFCFEIFERFWEINFYFKKKIQTGPGTMVIMLLFSEMLNLQEEYSICWNGNFKINFEIN